MKSIHLICLLPCIWMTACCTLECVGPLDRDAKPYLHYWEKPGISPEQLKDDSVLCGGTRDEIKPFYPQVDEEQLMLSGETIWKTREQLGVAWVNCMKEKGYRYVD